MPAPNSSVPFDMLLEHARFVRHLARDLLGDGPESDDVVQQTWLVALKSPPNRPEAARSWLGSVARNVTRKLWREEGRREAREVRAARDEALPSAEDLVLRESTLSCVVEAVRGLPTAHREVILLRFYEDLPPREISRRLGVSVNTVNSRLRRALLELRERLDAQSGGDGKSWRAGLLALVGSVPKSGASVSLIVAAATVFLLVLGGAAGWIHLREDLGQVPLSVASDDLRVVPITPRATGPVVAPTPFVEPESPPAARAAIRSFVRVSGRTLASGRRPAAGARVIIAVKGGASTTLRSDADGAFAAAIETPVRSGWVELGVRAEFQSRAAVMGTRVRFGQADAVVGDLVLVRGSRPEVVVVEERVAVSDARVFVRLDEHSPHVTPIEGVPEDCWIGEFRTDATGRVRLPLLPPGRLLIRAERGAAVGVLDHAIPLPANRRVVPVALEPSVTMRITVRESGSERPLEGVALTLGNAQAHGRVRWVDADLSTLPEPTDADGVTVVHGVPSRARLVLMERGAEGVAATSTDFRFAHCRALKAVTAFFPPARMASWAAPGLPDGPVVLECFVGDGKSTVLAEAAIVNERLVARSLPVTLSALRVTVPGIGTQRLKLHDPRPVRPSLNSRWVQVFDDRGEPVVGMMVSGSSPRGVSQDRERAVTDAEGVAEFLGLEPGDAEFVLEASSLLGSARHVLGTTSESEVAYELPMTSMATFRFTKDDVIGLPDSYALLLPHGVPLALLENPTTGIAAVRYVPEVGAPEDRYCAVIASGYKAWVGVLHANARAVDVPLRSLGTARVRIRPPRDGWYLVGGERFDGSAWRNGGAAMLRTEGDLNVVFDRVAEGRFRVVDQESGLVSREIVITPTTGDQEFVFDLTSTAWVRGRVEMGPGVEGPASVRTVDAEGRKGRWFAVALDGRFRVRVPGDRPVRLEVGHALALSDPESEATFVTGPTDDIVLRLVDAPLGWLDLDVVDAPLDEDEAVASGRILVRPAGSYELPDHGYRVRSGSLGLALRNCPPGHHDLWLDLPGKAPVWVQDVEVVMGEHRIGPVILRRGAAVAVRILRGEGVPTPITVRVQSMNDDVPHYARSATGSDAVVTAEGLGPGKFRVTLRVEDPKYAARGRTEIIHLAGDETAELVLDLR